jgi:single-strand DNA-binding protein
MASENTVTIVGNLVDEPELRYTPSGSAVASFKVAVNKRWKGQDGQWEEKLDGFFRCNCWNNMAESVTESLGKGTRVVVVGRLQQRSWDTAEGQKRYEIEIQVDEVGPSLKWATATVTKSQRSGGFNQSSNQGGGFNQGQSQGGGQNQGQGQSAGQGFGSGGFGGGQGPQPAPTPSTGQDPQPASTPSTGGDWGSSAPAGTPADEGGF